MVRRHRARRLWVEATAYAVDLLAFWAWASLCALALVVGTAILMVLALVSPKLAHEKWHCAVGEVFDL